MNQEADNLIPIDAPKSDFQKFLNAENKRIFFSGEFGIGKTFFLREFFKEHKDKFDTYHLFPVRYQIASNENIIELLKYDIIIEFLNKYPNAFQGNEIKGANGWFAFLYSFFKEKSSVNGFLQSVIKGGEGALAFSPDPLCQIISKLGRPLKDLLNIDKEFQEFKNKYLTGGKQLVDEFIKEIQQSPSSVATDYLSYLLCNKIAQMKAKKKSVLVLDDFDRVDPEHIFRILNVLSAHMEGDEENKFGFDHIIIVGDVKNIENIFHHKYGEKTEFGGYFDKFFTTHPYRFNNQKAIAEKLPKLLKLIKCEGSSIKDAYGEGGIIKNFFHEILTRAFLIREMNLRKLYKPMNYQFSEVDVNYQRDPFIDGHNLCIDSGIKLLIAIYNGDKEYFLGVLKKIRDASSESDIKSAWFYNESSKSMLKYMLSLEPNTNITWLKKYPISLTHAGDFQFGAENKAHARFFYDTLVEYVIKSKYEKESYHDYLQK